MIVCHCKAVSDREIRRAVRAGASRPAEVARVCGAASECGGCVGAVLDIMADESAPPSPPAGLGVGLAPAR